jgi:hypothetical protein
LLPEQQPPSFLFNLLLLSTASSSMSAFGYPVVASGYPPRPPPYLMSPSPYYPQGPMAYGQPGKLSSPT